MKKIIHSILSFFHEHITGVKPPPGFLAAVSTLVILLTVGTFFYSSYEGWSYIDSLYFCVITLATVGYGDLHPTTPTTKLFTIAYIFIGVGLGFYIFSTVARSLMEGRVTKTNLEHFIPLRESIDKYWDRSKFNYAVFSQAILETNNQFQYNGMYRY